MTTSKKLIITLIAGIIVLCLLGLTACAAPPQMLEGDFSKVINRALPQLSTDANGDIAILQLTDLHLHGNDSKKEKKTLEGVRSLIENGEYALVVITGDMVDGYNNYNKFNKAEALRSIAELMEEHEQYWAYTPGNNDGEFCGSNTDVLAFLAGYEHCLISDVGVGGAGNYVIDAVNGGKAAHKLIFVDSRMRGVDGEMLAIDQSQIDWYETAAAEARADGVLTSTFMHVPFLEFADAYRNGEVIDSYSNTTSTLEINVNSDSSRLYDAITAAGNNGLIGTGHTHGSDYLRFYEGEYLLQVRACGFTEWNDDLERGGAKIVIHTAADSIRDMYTITSVNFCRQ